MNVGVYEENTTPLQNIDEIPEKFAIRHVGFSQDKYIKRFDIGTEHKGEITCNNAYGGKKIQIKIYHKDKPNENLLNEMWATIQQEDLLNDDIKGCYYINNPQKLQSIAQCVGGVLYEEQEKAKQNKKDFFGEVYVCACDEAYINLRDYLLQLQDIQDEKLLETLRGWDCIDENANGEQIVAQIKTKLQSLRQQDLNIPPGVELGVSTKAWLSAFALNMQNAKLKQPLYPQNGIIDEDGNGFVSWKGHTSKTHPEGRISKERYEMLCNVQFFVRCVPDCTLPATKRSNLRTLPYDSNGTNINLAKRKINIIDHNNYFGYGDMDVNKFVHIFKQNNQGDFVKQNSYEFYYMMAQANLDMAFNITKMKQKQDILGTKKIHLIIPGIGAWSANNKETVTKNIILAYTNALRALVEKHKNDPDSAKIANYDNIEFHFLSSDTELQGFGIERTEGGYNLDLKKYLKDEVNDTDLDEIGNIKMYQFDYEDSLTDFPENNGIDEWFYCHPGDHQAWYGNDTLLQTALYGTIFTGSAEQTAAKTNFLAPFGNQQTKFNQRGVFQWNLKTMATPNDFIAFIDGHTFQLYNGNKKQKNNEEQLNNNNNITKNNEEKNTERENQFINPVNNNKDKENKNNEDNNGGVDEDKKKIDGLELYTRFYIADLNNKKKHQQEEQEGQEDEENKANNPPTNNPPTLEVPRPLELTTTQPTASLLMQTPTQTPVAKQKTVLSKISSRDTIKKSSNPKPLVVNQNLSTHQNNNSINTSSNDNFGNVQLSSGGKTFLPHQQSNITGNKNTQQTQNGNQNSANQNNNTNNNQSTTTNNDIKEKNSYVSSVLSGLTGATGIGVGIFLKKNRVVMITCIVIGGVGVILSAFLFVKTYRHNHNTVDANLRSINNNSLHI